MEKIWLKSYEEGVRAEVDVHAYASVCAVFHESVRKFGNRPGFSNFGVTKTYAETAALVNTFTSYLQNVLNIRKGDRVAVMMPNVLQYPVAVFGILQAGGVVVNINPLYTPRELAHQLHDSGATTIIVLENFADTLESALAETDIKNVIITSMGDLLGGLKGALMNFIVRKVKKMVPPHRIAHAIPFQAAMKQGMEKPFISVPLQLEDLAFLQYTGGTTGVAKGAELTHGNIVANMQQAAEWIKSKLIDGKEVVITALPLYHIFSLTVNLMIFTKHGAHNVLITNPRDLPAFIRELKRYPVSVFTGVNTLFNGLIHRHRFSTLDFSTWKIALGGGMAVQQGVANEWKHITGIPIIEAYGLTETSPGVCVNPLNATEYTGCIGLPIPNTDIEIRNEANEALGVGEAGELWVKGPQVMRGYWRQPEETAKAIDARGFFATGDIVMIRQDGYLRLIDRKKDMIVVSGFNVYPNEVEDVVSLMPGVLEVACIGEPNEKTGESLKLFVVKKDPALSQEDIIAHCRKNLTAYKVPRNIEFCEELPKSNIGKILRKDLRKSA
ncbi:AMP-binding protein [Stenoxybacter acetivorans]|uniref:AMP-binding protein n=1 Tax=Stenoxybacter acetivorans TaxID=422441 RepID=UPI00055D8BB4|nr:AMP-binding protein [Stenoxybacter acetivorans]